MSGAKRPTPAVEERLDEAMRDWLNATEVEGPEAQAGEVGAGRDDLDRLFELLDGHLSEEDASQLRERLENEPRLAEQWQEVQASVADLVSPSGAVDTGSASVGRGLGPRSLVWFAAAAVLVLTSVWWIWNTVQLGQGEVLASALREEVQEVLRSGVFERPASVSDLRPATGSLREAGSLVEEVEEESARGSLLARPQPIAPVGTWTTPYPEFRWLEVEGALSYSLVVTDSGYEEIARVDGLESTSWQPDRDWPPGRVLVWQVAAKLADGSEIRAPVPPEPEVRFGVLAERDLVPVERLLGDVEAAAVGLSTVERAVARASVYSKAGLMAAAERELSAVAPAERTEQIEALESSLAGPPVEAPEPASGDHPH